MIPWIREKFAERRARWMAARSKRNENSEERNEEGNRNNENNVTNGLVNLEERLQGSSNIVNSRQTNRTNPLDRILPSGVSHGRRNGNVAVSVPANDRRHPPQHLRFYTPDLLRRLRPTAATSRSLRSLRNNLETTNSSSSSHDIANRSTNTIHELRQEEPATTNSSQHSLRTSSQVTLCSRSSPTNSNNTFIITTATTATSITTNTTTSSFIINNTINIINTTNATTTTATTATTSIFSTNTSTSTSESHSTLFNFNCPFGNLKARASNEALEDIPGPPEDVQPLSVHVICPSGRVLVFQVTANKTLMELKNEVLLELSDDSASLPLFASDIRTLNPRYRLIRAEYSGSDLNESLTLNQLSIMNNDTLVLVLRRSFQPATYNPTVTSRPNDTQINEATKNLTRRSENMPTIDTNEIFQQSNIQFDVRKVLISLAQASAVILGAGPYAERLIETLKQKIINKKNFQNDTLQCLIDMGFTKEHAEYALKLHNGVYASAIEWLLMTQNDKDAIDTAGKSAMQKSESTISASLLKTSDTDILANTEALLEIVRIYSHRDTPPTQDTIDSLKQMGFNEDDILVALKKTCNNKAAACEWLCGNRTGSLIELRDGLSQDSPILKTILEMHEVQYNLGNPKVFLAFLAILENENLLRIWGGDNDTSTVITSILQKYHEEKHILGLNQFYAPQHS